MYRCVDLKQHRADDQRMTSKYRESDLKARRASVLCSSRGDLMSYNDRSAWAVPLH